MCCVTLSTDCTSGVGAAAMHMLNRRGVVSIDKTRTLLGYQPVVTFDEGMRRCEEWAHSEGLI